MTDRTSNAPLDGRRGDLEFVTIPGMLRRCVERFGSSSAVEEDGSVLTYADLGARVERAARALIAAGVSPGDRVAIWAPNIHEWIVAALGVHSTAGVVVPINTRFKGGEAAQVLRRSRARVLFTVTGFLDTDYVELLQRADPDLPDLHTTVVLRGQAPEGTSSWAEFLEGAEAIAPGEVDQRIATLGSDDLCDILFTSGTTGRPKGALSTHGQTLRAFRDWSDVIGLRAGDRYLVVVPFFHSFGYKAGWLAALMMGATVLPHLVFDAAQVMRRIAPDRVSVLPGPPALYQSIMAHPEFGDHDLSSLRLAVTGAAVIPVELIHRMADTMGFETIITGYGLTEATGIATMCRYDDDPETIASTSGRAIPGVEVRVVDDSGNEAPRGEPGEVVVRGYNVTQGFLDDPEETARAIDADGFLHTGDIGVMDDHGYLRITDRKKDMFIVGGFNAYPAEIENILLTHPCVVHAAVIGVPHDRLGEVARAFLVLTHDAEPAQVTEEAFIAWSRAAMANYKVPRSVVTMDALPRNATGKVQKFKLRELG
jgi:acyl-CoA synthetase (AMP-forming)/AMP-acid ligase II